MAKLLICHDQRDDDLAAVTALVAAVAVLPQVVRTAVFVGFEVGAGQVVQQHVELGAEEFSAAPHEELVERVRVLHQPVQAAVQGVLLGQGEVRLQEVGHGARIEPLAVQAPLGAGVDEAVAIRPPLARPLQAQLAQTDARRVDVITVRIGGKTEIDRQLGDLIWNLAHD